MIAKADLLICLNSFPNLPSGFFGSVAYITIFVKFNGVLLSNTVVVRRSCAKNLVVRMAENV